jgi:hypothetical protein
VTALCSIDDITIAPRCHRPSECEHAHAKTRTYVLLLLLLSLLSLLLSSSTSSLHANNVRNDETYHGSDCPRALAIVASCMRVCIK